MVMYCRISFSIVSRSSPISIPRNHAVCSGGAYAKYIWRMFKIFPPETYYIFCLNIYQNRVFHFDTNNFCEMIFLYIYGDAYGLRAENSFKSDSMQYHISLRKAIYSAFKSNYYYSVST